MALLVAVTLALVTSWPTATADPGHVTPGERRMAQALVALSYNLAAIAPLELEELAATAALSAFAVQLDPENPEILRQASEIATLAENTELFDELLKKRHDLEPGNDVLSLLTLESYITTLNTADERIKAYETLLSDPVRANLTAPIVSRLSLNLALLHERIGDHEAYARWLGDAVAIDPSHGAALHEASRFYRQHSDDTIGTAELVLSMVRADPTDLPAQLLVGRLLLEHGAYTGAARIYDLAVASFEAQGVPVQDDFLSDAALAKWGGAGEEEVLRWLNDFDKSRKSERSPGQELLITSLSPALNSIRLAIASRAGIESDKMSAVRGLNDSFELGIADLKAAAAKESANADENTLTAIVSQMQLEWAWLLLLTDSDLQQASSLIQGLMDAGQLNTEATDRFAGWLALRSGNEAKALELLEKIAEDNDLAVYGIALINKRNGNNKEAAQGFLRVARSRAGSIVGIMAAYELWNAVGQKVPIDQTAKRLDSLVRALPRVIDKAPTDPTQLVTFRIRPTKTPIAPFESPVLEIEIANKTEFPIAIGDVEPLQPNVLLDLTVRSAYRKLDRVPPLVVDVGRRLRLEPREMLVIPVDLNVSSIGNTLQRIMSEGLTIEIKGFTNFLVYEVMTRQGIQMTFRPGLLGSQATSPSLRVDGIIPSEQWLQEAIDTAKDPDHPESLVMLALLSQLLDAEAEAIGAQSKLRDIPEDLVMQAREAVREGYKKQPLAAKGWLLSVMYSGDVCSELISSAATSSEPMEQLGFLLNTWSERYSLMDGAALGVEQLIKSSDPTVSLTATAIQKELVKIIRTEAQNTN